ncbi:hypothetical protein TRAPUB_7923 [Trametes pubescens]|uniref:Uncharacterized protein n=1 Tax=Trametes pubescens TaxID=154538 RepID=A0A1M2V206_TRAPU|nr:hypothetical protein TRAPUB_7923 [Trametes pubescens]
MATLYIRPGPRDSLLGNPDKIAPLYVVLILDGYPGDLMLVLPTCGVEELSSMCFEHWVPSIQGPMFDKCDGTDEQHELLLHIALAYHAFVEGFPGVEPTDYFHFAGRLVEVALATEPDEDIEDRIVELVEWLHKCLPMALFEGPHVPHVTDGPLGVDSFVYSLSGGLRLLDPWTSLRDIAPSAGEGSGLGDGEGDADDVASNGSMPDLVDVSDDD